MEMWQGVRKGREGRGGLRDGDAGDGEAAAAAAAEGEPRTGSIIYYLRAFRAGWKAKPPKGQTESVRQWEKQQNSTCSWQMAKMCFKSYQYKNRFHHRKNARGTLSSTPYFIDSGSEKQTSQYHVSLGQTRGMQIQYQRSFLGLMNTPPLKKEKAENTS